MAQNTDGTPSDSREETSGTNKLNWSAELQPNETCHYNHCTATTPFGRFLLTWKAWKDYPGFGFDETPWGNVEYQGWFTVKEAQQWAESELSRRCRSCLELLL